MIAVFETCAVPHLKALSVDLLMPNVGEVAGGTVREERFRVLAEKLERFHSIILPLPCTCLYFIAVFNRAVNISGKFSAE